MMNLPFIDSLEKITQTTQALFGAASADQINWKPAPDRWSIAQCYDHMLTAHDLYFPIFERILVGEREFSRLRNFPLLAGLMGWAVLRSLESEAARLLKAAAVIRPSQSKIEVDIIDRFLAHQAELIRYARLMDELEVNQVIIVSPVNSRVAYSLEDGLKIIAAHEILHLNQARLVWELLAKAGQVP